MNMDTPGLHHHSLYQDVSLLCQLPSLSTGKMEIPNPRILDIMVSNLVIWDLCTPGINNVKSGSGKTLNTKLFYIKIVPEY